MGVLSALPIVAAGNICCCLWVVSGGIVAVYVLQQNQPAPVTPADGALVGLLAGLIGAGIYAVLSIPINILLGSVEQQMLERLSATGALPPRFRDYMAAPSPIVRSIGILIGIVAMFFAGAVFSTLGGLLGSVIFVKKDVQPPAPPAG